VRRRERAEPPCCLGFPPSHYPLCKPEVIGSIPVRSIALRGRSPAAIVRTGADRILRYDRTHRGVHAVAGRPASPAPLKPVEPELLFGFLVNELPFVAFYWLVA
jgi:hypothetical protein